MRPAELVLAGHRLLLDPAGVLFWPDERLMVVADLHLEKGAAFARRGVMLPPHDTLETLDRLERALERLRPSVVVSLGDAFHDRLGWHFLSDELAERIRRLTRRHRWIWISGNHDPDPPVTLGGEAVAEIELGGLVLRHAPDGRAGPEIVGHLHPRAKLRLGLRTLRLNCFVADARCLVLPAFGAFTGGLNVLDRAICGLFGAQFATFVLGEASCRRVPHHLLLGDPTPSRLAPAP